MIEWVCDDIFFSSQNLQAFDYLIFKIWNHNNNVKRNKNYKRNILKMKRCTGALNNKGYSENLKYGGLPAVDHITYSGSFNSHFYQVGKKAEFLSDVYLGYGSANFDTVVAKEIT